MKATSSGPVDDLPVTRRLSHKVFPSPRSSQLEWRLFKVQGTRYMVVHPAGLILFLHHLALQCEVSGW